MSTKIAARINRIKDYEKDYIEQIKNAVETIPTIEKNIEWLDWAERSVNSSEQVHPGIFDTTEIENTFTLIEDSIKSVLPDISISAQLVGGTVRAANATISGMVMERINASPYVSQSTFWVNHLHSDYYRLQKKQDFVDDIYRLLKDLSLKDEFLKAVDKHSKLKSAISSNEEVAIIMRNVIEGIQGYLFQLVRRNSKIHQRKKRVMWDHIGDTLAIRGATSSQSQLLRSKKILYDNLHNELTDIAKNSTTPSIETFQALYSKWLEFLYTTLNLIDPKYLK